MSLREAVREDGTLLLLTFDRPKGNVLDGATLRELRAALSAHRADRALRLVVLRGEGGNFSYGASVEEHRREHAPAMLAAFHACVRDIAAFPVPVAALVEGRCLGGAFEVALGCHFVFATPGAVFGCPEIKLGVFPPVLAAIGHLRLGGPLAERLLLTGEDLAAPDALAAGLLTEVVQGDALEGVLAWYRSRLRPLSAEALRHATRAARTGSGVVDALAGALSAVERQYLDGVLASHDGNEGIEAFLARRAPRWEDR